MSKLTGVVDEPVAPGGQDYLGIEVHSKSLIKFVDRAHTPITIGIQGEWGSGKTSLINSIYHFFEGKREVKQIWINSWEYSLLSAPDEALLKIVNKILDDLLEADGDISRGKKIKQGASQIFKGALRISASVAIGSEASKVADELLQSTEQSISTLRKQLSDLVHDIEARKSNPYNKVVIYVDDLDRIEPRHAVSILELLKNIFNVPNCVFILAIDYQVVVKGLEHKFGKQTPENEWEFQAFFDKIIQLPFMMPMGQYDIGQYVNALLVEIGFVDAGELNQEDVREIILHTIGGNPRSIKRLVNSVSLIQIFTETKSEESETKNLGEKENRVGQEQFLLFSLLCLQIAYPQIYSLLNKEPNFPSWDETFAFQETDKSEETEKELFDRDFKLAKQSEDCDEDWEQALFRVCYVRPRLKLRFRDISKFLSKIKDDIFSKNLDNLGEVLSEILTQTSVTSVITNNSEQQGHPKGRKNIFDANIWQKRLASKLNETELEKVSKLLSMFETGSKYLKVNFSKSDGASFYHPETQKVCMRMTVLGNKNDKNLLLYSLSRDFSHNFNLPKIKGIEVTGYKKPTPEDRKKWTGSFQMMCPIHIIDDEKFRIFNDIAMRNFELHNKINFENQAKLKEIGLKIKAGDQQAIQWCEELFALEPYEYS